MERDSLSRVSFRTYHQQIGRAPIRVVKNTIVFQGREKRCQRKYLIGEVWQEKFVQRD